MPTKKVVEIAEKHPLPTIEQIIKGNSMSLMGVYWEKGEPTRAWIYDFRKKKLDPMTIKDIVKTFGVCLKLAAKKGYSLEFVKENKEKEFTMRWKKWKKKSKK